MKSLTIFFFRVQPATLLLQNSEVKKAAPISASLPLLLHTWKIVERLEALTSSDDSDSEDGTRPALDYHTSVSSNTESFATTSNSNNSSRCPRGIALHIVLDLQVHRNVFYKSRNPRAHMVFSSPNPSKMLTGNSTDGCRSLIVGSQEAKGELRQKAVVDSGRFERY
ncbi:hypothetical protein L218DRAFT_735745 [Marasmius fiardii PR-910]|nr:hypothetical protein L218DRAFT_735745 [Marasmius fiardii PR-910]